MNGSVLRHLLPCAAILITGGCAAQVQLPSETVAYTAEQCPPCAGWNEPTAAVKVFANTYYVGTRGLAAVLITSPDGHVLIDGGLPESAPRIIEGIRSLGFDIRDVELILNSHAHYDHSGGIAALQRASGSRVAASPHSLSVLDAGATQPNDPQHALHLDYPRVPNVQPLADGDTLQVGPLRLVAHFTPGHAPGGTSWQWRSCEQDRCLVFVYADSQTSVSDDEFRFSRNTRYPHVLQDFERSFAVLERLQCDVLLTPHPGASRFWQRIENPGGDDQLVDGEACRRYAAGGRRQLSERVARHLSERLDTESVAAHHGSVRRTG